MVTLTKPQPTLTWLLRFHEHNPLRPLSWRWDLATRWANDWTGSPPRRLDPWLAEAVRYRRALDRCRSRRDLTRLARRMPSIDQALQLNRLGYPGEWQLQAWLLTAEPLAAIATRLALPVEALEAYEALFFCVRDRLPARDYIVGQTIGLHDIGSWCPPSIGDMARSIAYHGGPYALEALLEHAIDEHGNLRALDLRDLHTTAGRQALKIQVNVAAMMAPTPRMLQELLRLRGQIAELDRDPEADHKPLSSLSDLDAMFEAVAKDFKARRLAVAESRLKENVA